MKLNFGYTKGDGATSKDIIPQEKLISNLTGRVAFSMYCSR